MKLAPYANELEWRHWVILQFIFLREAIYFVAFVIALIAAGFVVSRWWPDAIDAAVAIAFVTAITNYLRAARKSSKSEKLFFKTDYD